VTLMRWIDDRLVWVPSAWTVFRIGKRQCRRRADGVIECFLGEKWRVVEVISDDAA